MATGICRVCGAVIGWRMTRSGRWQPVDSDGQVHFPTCRRRVADGRAMVRTWYDRLQAQVAKSSERGVNDEG
jgi:hypothetical protein